MLTQFLSDVKENEDTNNITPRSLYFMMVLPLTSLLYTFQLLLDFLPLIQCRCGLWVLYVRESPTCDILFLHSMRGIYSNPVPLISGIQPFFFLEVVTHCNSYDDCRTMVAKGLMRGEESWDYIPWALPVERSQQLCFSLFLLDTKPG